MPLQDARPPHCDESTECITNCCMPSTLLCCYFVSYVVFTQFVLLNIVLAVLMNEKSAKEKQKLIYGNKKTNKPAVEEQVEEEDDIDPIDFIRTTATCQLCGVGDGKTYLINNCYVGVDVDVCALCASALCANMRMRKNSL